jgi:hypothetical protein
LSKDSSRLLLVNPIDSAIGWPLSHCVLCQWLFFLEITIANSLLLINSFGLPGCCWYARCSISCRRLPHFISLAVIVPVRPSYSNRASCLLEIVGQSSISIPQQFWHDYYCRSPSVANFTFDSYSLITVVTVTTADLRIVNNNRLSFCHPLIYIKVLESESKHKHGGFNINYEKATVVWQEFGLGS